MTIFYFTSTGNCLALAKQIGGELISIAKVVDDMQGNFKDDVIGVIFPVYANAPPKIVSRFLEKVKFEAEYTFAIGTYGKIAGACMHNLQKKALKLGYRFDYVNQLLMVDNFLPMFDINKEIEKLPTKQVEEATKAIIKDIKERKYLTKKANIPSRVLAFLLSGVGNSSNDAKGYIVEDSCNKCGVCVKACPVKNIMIDALNDKLSFSDHCLGCLGCIHICPQNALHLKNEKSNKRWRHPEVTLQEIIEANNKVT